MVVVIVLALVVVAVVVVVVEVARWFVGLSVLGVLLEGQGRAAGLIVVPLPMEKKRKNYKCQNITGHRIKVHG